MGEGSRTMGRGSLLMSHCLLLGPTFRESLKSFACYANRQQDTHGHGHYRLRVLTYGGH